MTRMGTYFYTPAGTTSNYKWNYYAGKGTGDFLDYGLEVNSVGTLNVVENEIEDCLGVATFDGSESSAIYIHDTDVVGNIVNITGNILSNSTSGVGVDTLVNDASIIVMRSNILTDVTEGLNSSTLTAVDAADNWWGHASGPKNTPSNAAGTGAEVIGNATFSPWATAAFFP